MTWLADPAGAHIDLEHLDGVPWHKAKKPRRLHRCRPQTSGWVGLSNVDRCACGAIRRDGGRWFERNSR